MNKLLYECEELCKSAELFQKAVNELWKSQNPDELQEGETAMKEEYAREIYSERWKSLGSAIYYMRKRMAASRTHPDQEDKPVGFVWRKKGSDDNFDWKFHPDVSQARDADTLAVTEIRLVYTRPDSSSLRKAAEALLFAHDNSEYCINEVKDLRAALDE